MSGWLSREVFIVIGVQRLANSVMNKDPRPIRIIITDERYASQFIVKVLNKVLYNAPRPTSDSIVA